MDSRPVFTSGGGWVKIENSSPAPARKQKTATGIEAWHDCALMEIASCGLEVRAGNRECTPMDANE
jgi:hypothetical protein